MSQTKKRSNGFFMINIKLVYNSRNDFFFNNIGKWRKNFNR